MRPNLHSPRQKLLRRKIREARKKAGLTQKVVAKKIGRHQSYISKIEIGEQWIETMDLDIILRAIEVNTEDFFAELKKHPDYYE